jgi:hypothetical protein
MTNNIDQSRYVSKRDLKQLFMTQLGYDPFYHPLGLAFQVLQKMPTLNQRDKIGSVQACEIVLPNTASSIT